MRRLLTILFLCSPVLGFCYEPINWASGWNWGTGTSKGMYDVSTVETIEGTVKRVGVYQRDKGIGNGTFVIVDTGGEEIAAALAPEWFIENQDVTIKEGEHIKVTGSRVTYKDLTAILASKIEVDGKEIELRDDDGTPHWSGWRQDDNWFNRGWRGA
ncbi:MAG: DNA-binding protein [Chlamydiales bacterium]|nr:DNA-binding protein [Chlamydiia bacterium]MCP5506915.1 DNA-binding protein [Chlamydiales bacterium]